MWHHPPVTWTAVFSLRDVNDAYHRVNANANGVFCHRRGDDDASGGAPGPDDCDARRGVSTCDAGVLLHRPPYQYRGALLHCPFFFFLFFYL